MASNREQCPGLADRAGAARGLRAQEGMIVCMSCDRVMVPAVDVSTAWIKQTKKEHPCTIARCPSCGAVVANVSKQTEKHAEEPWPGDLVLDLKLDES
jgi:uncharacterized protein with PIN domain